jgi:putative sigma-54 modulation protein
MDGKVILSGVHLDLTDAIRDYAREKAGRLLRHGPKIIRIWLEFELRNHRSHSKKFRVLGKIEGGRRGEFIVASEEGEDLYATIDSAIEKLDRRLCTPA